MGDKVLDQGEVSEILKYLKKQRLTERSDRVREWAAVAIPLQAGLRVSEVSKLCCGDLVLTEYCPAIQVRDGKGHKDRQVKISPSFRDELTWYLGWKKSVREDVGPEGPVVVSRLTGKALSRRALQDNFKRVLNKVGIKKRNNYHMARHTFATHLLKASNRNLVFVRDQLGHSSIAVTEVYLHVLPGEDQKALERLYR